MSAPDSSPSADRNLLLGILALQMDFVSRDALINAMNAWVLQKTTPLGQILLDQSALRVDTHALLQALVLKHLEMHGGDAQKSLASVSSLGSARRELEQIADAEVLASLATVSAARPAVEDPWATRPPTVGESTSAGQRFRVLRPHAKGGLGEVFVAHDSELGREVALKEIQDRYADDQNSRSRFVLEAEITGGLEHPGIVPVYGLGQYADGRPFYAMRFIRGDSLQDAIARFHRADAPNREAGERTLALRKLLNRFLDVCNAVAYAHSRGVLHRDLKPGNIMLGKFGETLVVDWGLAKPLERIEAVTAETMEGPLQPCSASGSNPTQMGSAIGTPAYMPPEQAAGRLDQLGPASDVYSLGATLYCLLTGVPPFEAKDIGAILRQVQQGELRPPRQVNSTVPAALEAVCLKATALKPDDRYASPRALAEDIEHWLADEPVSAWREPWRIRARRWVGRHRTLVTTAAATLLVAMVSLTVATILLQAANKRERQANDEKEMALQQAEQQAAIALAVNEFLEKDLLGQAAIRRQIAGPREGRDPDVKVRTLLDRASKSIESKFKDQPLTEAAIHLTIGNAYRAMGRSTEAQRHLEQSLQLRMATLGAEHPDTLKSKNDLAMVYSSEGTFDLAGPYFQEVLQARTATLGADHPDTLITKSNLAVLYWTLGKYSLAEPLLKEVLQAFTAKLGADHPDTLTSKYNLARMYLAQGKYGFAEPLCNEAVQGQIATLGADHPDTLTSKVALAELYHSQGNDGLAEPLLKGVLQGQTAKLGADHPDTLTTKSTLALLYLDQSKYGLAEPLLMEVLQAETAKLGADHSNTLITKNNLAILYYVQGKYGLAEPLLKEVLQALSAKFGAEHLDTLNRKNGLALLYVQQGKYGLAEPLLKEVLQVYTAKRGADHPSTIGTMVLLSFNVLRQKRYAECESILRDCLAKQDKKQPDLNTFNARSILGEALTGQGKYAEAEPLLLQGYEGMKQREQSIPPHHIVRPIEALERLVQLYDAWGKKEKADDYRKKIAEERAKLQATNK